MTDRLAIRRIAPDSTIKAVIQILYSKTGELQNLVYHFNVIPNGEITWTTGGQSIVYGCPHAPMPSSLHIIPVLDEGAQKQISVPEHLPELYTGQLSPKGNELIVYTVSNEEDIWVLGDWSNWNNESEKR